MSLDLVRATPEDDRSPALLTCEPKTGFSQESAETFSPELLGDSESRKFELTGDGDLAIPDATLVQNDNPCDVPVDCRDQHLPSGKSHLKISS